MSWDFIWYDILPYVGLACLLATGLVMFGLASILIKAKLDAWEARNQAAVRRMHEHDHLMTAVFEEVEHVLKSGRKP